MAGQVTIDFSARAPALAASSVRVRIFGVTGAVISAKAAGLTSDGSLSVMLANGQTLPVGRYRYEIDGIAQGAFEVLSGRARAPAPAAGGAAARDAGKPAPPSAGAHIGIWYGIAGTPGSIELRPDGTYRLNGGSGGWYRRSGNALVFEGAAAAWNRGQAQLKDGVIEFKWKNAEGFNNWFVFQKGG
jgi:hypothetical protein